MSLTTPAPDEHTLPPPSVDSGVTLGHDDAGGEGAPPRVPGYEVQEELGRGGMGVVYRARQTALGREVALKMILAGGHAGEEARARFRTEAEAVARLSHPNIVQVFEVGEAGGLPFLSLEFVDGGSLERKLAATPLKAREAAALVEALAGAMHYAHERGVVHRDLKPANVLLASPVASAPGGRHGEGARLSPGANATGLAGYTPKVTDFGLAKKLGEQGQTQTGAILGTPSYMAPEQAEAKKEVGPSADLYALGAILYECLTSRPPFRAANPLDTILQLLTDDPVPVRQLQPGVPVDLETVCHKCLHKDPARRYPGALALADDLRRFLAGEPVNARPVGRLERGARWVRRRPAAAALLALAALATAAFVLLTARHDLQLRRALDDTAEQKRLADEQQRRAVRREEEARRLQYVANINLALDAYRGTERGRIRRLRAFLDRSIPAPGEEDLRRFEWWYLRGITHAHLREVIAPVAGVATVAASPDGRWLAVGDDLGDFTGAIHLLDAASGREVWRRPTALPVVAAAFSPDGRRVACAATRPPAGIGPPGVQGAVTVHDVATGEERARHAPLAGCGFLRFSPGGEQLLVAELQSDNRDAPRRLLRLNAARGNQLGAVSLRSSPVPFLPGIVEGNLTPHGAALSPDGKLLAVFGNAAGASWKGGIEPGRLILYQADTGRRIRVLESPGALTSAAFLDGGKRLVAGAADSMVRLWDLAEGKLLWSQKQALGGRSTVAVSPDGTVIAVANAAGLDGEVVLRDAGSGLELRTIVAHEEGVNGLAWLPDGTLVSGSDDDSVKWWDGRRQAIQEHFGVEMADPIALAVGGGDKVLAVSAQSHSFFARNQRRGVIQWWDTATQRQLAVTPTSGGPARHLAASPNGKTLAAIGEDGALRLWDVETRKEHKAPRGLPPGLLRAAWAPDSRRLALAAGKGGVVVWDTTKAEAALVRISDAPVSAVAWSPDGVVLAGAVEGDAVLWYATNGRLMGRWQARIQPRAQYLVFSPDGETLATDDWFDARLWDVRTGELRHSLRGHAAAIGQLSFASDGRTVVTAGGDGAVKLWDPESGMDRFTFRREGRSPVDAAFLPAGDALAVAWVHYAPGSMPMMELSLYRAGPGRRP
jgi:WD40 repeat protein